MKIALFSVCVLALACEPLPTGNPPGTYNPLPTHSSPDAGSPDSGTTTPYIIRINGYRFSPESLVVPAGATVAVINQDIYLHSVTSTPSAGLYLMGSVNGVSFDTGFFKGQTQFTLPNDAPSGTTIPYFCRVHTSMMANQATITIE